MDDELRWAVHVQYAQGKATAWTLQFRRLAHQSKGVSPEIMRRLYLTVLIPKLMYAADVWYTPIYQEDHCKTRSGNVGFARTFGSIQRMAVLSISGALAGTVTDIAEIHMNILPLDLQLEKACFYAHIRHLALPPTHPLHPLIRATTFTFPKQHRSPLHNLAHIFADHTNSKPVADEAPPPYDELDIYNLNSPTPPPNEPLPVPIIETVTPIRRLPAYTLPYTTIIAKSREESKTFHKNIDDDIQIFTDGSGYKGGVGAAAVLYRKG